MTHSDIPVGSEGESTMHGGQLFELRREMNRLFEEVLRGDAKGDGDGSPMTLPRIDMHEGEGWFRICAELPGLAPGNIDVRLEGDLLTIHGEKHCEQTDERAHIAERVFGTFHRTIGLPFRPDANQVQASFVNGVLQIVLRKPQAGKNRRIDIDGANMDSGRPPEARAAQAADGGTLVLDQPLDPSSSEQETQGAEPGATGVFSADANPQEYSASNRSMQTEPAPDQADTGAAETEPSNEGSHDRRLPSYFGWRIGRRRNA